MNGEEELTKSKQLRHSEMGIRLPYYLVAIICKPESMIGFLLCGFAKISEGKSNYLIVDNSKCPLFSLSDSLWQLLFQM